MQYSLSCLLVFVGVFFQVKGFADDSLFDDENLGDPTAFYSESSSDSFALTDLAGNLIQDDDGSFDTLAFPEDEDSYFDTLASLPAHEFEPASVVADCHATGGLGKRDDTLLCPTNDFKGPELPTLDGITDKFKPPNEQDNALQELNLLNYQAPPGDNNKCPPGRPYQLCCNCDGNFEFRYCDDCRQSKPLSHFSK